MWNTRVSHLLLVECKNGTATFKDSLVVSYRSKHTLAIYSSNLPKLNLEFTPWNLLK